MTETRKIVRVTGAQVEAARLLVELYERDGEEVPWTIKRIANPDRIEQAHEPAVSRKTLDDMSWEARNPEQAESLRAYLRSNMHDGDEGGTVTVSVKQLLDETVEVVGLWMDR